MTEPSARDTAEVALTTTLPLLVVPCILAILSGVLLQFSLFFGISLVVVAACFVLYAIYRIDSTKNLAVKTVEVCLLGVVIPLVAIASVISAVPEFFNPMPMVTNALYLLLFAIAMPHRLLLQKSSEQLNLRFLLVYSFALIVASLIGTGFIFGHWGWSPRYGVPNGFPTCCLIIYALGPFFDSTFKLRDTLPISKLESAALLMSFLGVTGCIVSNFYLPALLPGSILASLVCALLYVRLDYLEHQMRTPHGQWTAQTGSDAYRHTAIKVLPLLTIAAWTGMGAYGSWAIRADAAERAAGCGTAGTFGRDRCLRGTRFTGTLIFSSIMVLGHIMIATTIQAMRERTPPLLKGQKLDRKTGCGIAAVVTVLLMKVAIACYYLFCPHVTLPVWVAMTIAGSLYLLVTVMLDCMRTWILSYNGWLLLASFGLGFYLLVTGGYLYDEYSAADAPPYLAVFLTGFLVCALLVVHFGMAIAEQDKKEDQMKKDPNYFANDGEQSGLMTATDTTTDTQD